MEGSLPGAIQEQELVFEEKRLSNDGTGTARSEQASQGSKEMDERPPELLTDEPLDEALLAPDESPLL